MNDIEISNFGFMLCDTARLVKNRFNSRAKKLGLSRVQWQVLSIVRRFEGLHQAALAERMEIEPITLTRLMERMEKTGWIERRPDPQDKRVRCVYLTPKVAPIVADMVKLGHDMMAEVMDGAGLRLKPDMMDVLERMNASLMRMPKLKA